MSLLTELSLRHRALTLLIAVLVILGSIYAASKLKVELIPDVELPVLSVVTVYPGASSQEVMEDITVPIESALSDVRDLENLQSTSGENFSLVEVRFERGTDMDEMENIIARRLSHLQLPSGAQRPQLFPFNLQRMLPIVVLSLSGDLEPAELYKVAETQVVPHLSALGGVSSVELIGGSKKKVIIDLDSQKMGEKDISVSQISAILQANGLTIPSGEIVVDHQVVPLRTSHEYTSLSEIEDMVVGANLETYRVFRLKDVAQVTLSTPPNTIISRTNGRPAIGIMVFKEENANTVSVANRVTGEVSQLQQSLGNQAQITIVVDQSTFIKQSLDALTQEAIIGAVLAILVILLFFMSLRASLVTIISIPLSILIGFFVMYWWGMTINIFTLSAMAIATGRVVDDSIVILENIYRHIQQGEGFRQASLNAAREVAAPITSATIATVAIFLPLAFVGGIAGKLFIPFALTTTFTLLASLLVALMVVPSLSSFLVSKKTEGERWAWYQRVYVRALRWSLARRALILIIVAAFFLGSLAVLPFIHTSLLPPAEENLLWVELKMPPGTTLETTSDKASELESLIDRNLDWKVYHTIVGNVTTAGLAVGASSILGGGSDTATVVVVLNSRADAGREAAELRRLSENIPGAMSLHISTLRSAVAEANTVDVVLTGENRQELAEAAQKTVAVLQGIDGLVNIESDAPTSRPQINIEVNPIKAMYYGLSTAQVGLELYNMMVGQTVTQLSLEGEVYDVFIGGIADEIDSIDEVKGLMVGAGYLTSGKMPVALGPTPVALDEIAEVNLVTDSVTIHRFDKQYAITVQGTVTKANVGSVNREAQKTIRSLDIPPGVEVEVGGVAREMEESFSHMVVAIIAAIGIVYIVMAVSLTSLLSPLIILFSLPLAFIGALFGLFLTQRALGISALMGLLMLVGVVLTNAIVLITVVEQLRQRGRSVSESLIEGGRIRLRPILMTALTTMAALVPLSLGLGEGTLITAELATVVIGGLLTSTLLTLLVIPVVYSLLERLFPRTRP